MKTSEQLILRKPDDWHVHLREGDMLAMTLKHAQHFARVLAMPNLHQPLVSLAHIKAYQKQIEKHNAQTDVYYTLYLTNQTSTQDIREIAGDDIVKAVKWYPAGATTNSASGVTNIENCYRVLEQMEKEELVLSIHGELTDSAIDIFHREEAFIDTLLEPLRKRFPALRIVLEHISTKAAVDYVTAGKNNLAATITPQHLLIQRNDLLVNGIKPHLYCLPIVKKESDRQALIDAATSGNERFFLGSDSAPHERGTKESACGCAGCYSADFALLLYTTVFESCGKLDMLEGFASVFGARFYGLELTRQTICLERKAYRIAPSYSYTSGEVVPLFAATTIPWSVS